MELKVKIEADGLEAAIHALVQTLSNQGLPVVETSEEEPDPKQEAPKKEASGKTENTSKEEPKQEDKEETVSSISLETVRVKLAELSQNGKQKEVKGLITSLGYKKLSDVPADRYAELLEKAAEL